jgi:hypothetical protein
MGGDLQEIGINLNVISNDEQLPEVKRYIQTVKERTRRVYNTVPFKRMPSIMVVQMVRASVFWLNMFPATDGVSNLSPTGIVVGLKLDYRYNKHCQLEFGSYVQVHEEHDNAVVTRTTGGIALRPTGNAQGGYYFLSLSSGRRLTRNNWTELPMPQEVIDRVHVLACRSNANRDLTSSTTTKETTMMMTRTGSLNRTETRIENLTQTPIPTTNPCPSHVKN